MININMKGKDYGFIKLLLGSHQSLPIRSSNEYRPGASNRKITTAVFNLRIWGSDNCQIAATTLVCTVMLQRFVVIVAAALSVCIA